MMEDLREERRRKNYARMRSVVDCTMGVVIFGFGIYFMIEPSKGTQFDIEPVLMYFFAGLCLLYGGWRIYRGYKQNYFSE
jgi:cation transport ATPase